MKRKVLAFLVASTMVVNPFNVVNAADFSDSVGQETDLCIYSVSESWECDITVKHKKDWS